jgi:hypothetical protein
MKDYERLCPVCGTAAVPEATQCAQCGTLLLGVDLTLKQAAAPPPAPATSGAPAGVRCPHDDCGAENPPSSERCLYCDRPLVLDNTAVPPAPTFYRLPSALAEKFRIVEVLPAGGAEAEIMVLAGLGSGVKVIAKLYRPGLLPKSEVLERVSRAAFRHVVHLIAWGESDGVGYEVMEYCAHGSLRGLVQDGPLPRDRLRDILVELAEALAALHELGVIHRDLKPENVLVRRIDPLDLVLTDFGIASINEATQVFTSLARSVRYGAPETLAGVLDRAADWWSLGMILAELVAGRHPFDGLSDAVVTHRLVTGTLDLADIDDPDWRKLCRGLLLRDPKRRWGMDEIRRWLAGDATLPAPAEDAPALPQAARPYRLQDMVCHTPAELAVALATHWEDGRKDLMRGQISAWVGQELKDDNLLRAIHDLLELRDVSDDLRLLRLLLRLAPDMPPVWRGESLVVAHLLARAAQAEQGDAAAAEWLASAFMHRALRELPAARFPAEAALAARWEIARERFGALWREAETARTGWRAQQARHGETVDFDALVFGRPEALEPPAPARIYPPLLLALADEDYAARLRDRARAATLPHIAHAPWLAALLESDEPAAWVVADRLAPHAEGAAEEARARRQRAAAEDAAEVAALVARANQALALLRAGETIGLVAGGIERATAASAAQSLLALLEEARARGLPRDGALLRTLQRAEPVVLRIQERLDAWEHAANVNAIWRNRNLGQGVGGMALLFFFLAVEGIGGWFLLGALALPAVVVLWRLHGVKAIRDDIRELCRALPLRVPAGQNVA